MKQFEIGKSYEWYQREYGSIEVLRRTPKCIVVTNGMNTWRMKVHTDESGNEFVIDTTVPAKWREAFTCSACYEEA